MTDTPMLDRALALAGDRSPAPQLRPATSLPDPLSLADDVMVAAAFLDERADELAGLAGDTPVTAGERHNYAAGANFRARSLRLFAHARDLARAEAAATGGAAS